MNEINGTYATEKDEENDCGITQCFSRCYRVPAQNLTCYGQGTLCDTRLPVHKYSPSLSIHAHSPLEVVYCAWALNHVILMGGGDSINSSIARLPLTSFRQERRKNKQREMAIRAEILNLSLKFKQPPHQFCFFSLSCPIESTRASCSFPRTSMAMSEELKQVNRWGVEGREGGHQTKENGTCVRNPVQIFWMMFLMGLVKNGEAHSTYASKTVGGVHSVLITTLDVPFQRDKTGRLHEINKLPCHAVYKENRKKLGTDYAFGQLLGKTKCPFRCLHATIS